MPLLHRLHGARRYLYRGLGCGTLDQSDEFRLQAAKWVFTEEVQGFQARCLYES